MGGSSPNQDIFDVRKIRRLVELMNEHDLKEMDIRQGDVRIQLRRGGEPAGSKVSSVPAPGLPAPAVLEPAKPAPVQPKEVAAEEDHIVSINSPMVGTFYAASDPDAQPYVSVGDSIGSETTVCIVEAMKVYNEIQAEVSGKIVAVLVKSGEPVEFGQPLFKVDTRQ